MAPSWRSQREDFVLTLSDREDDGGSDAEEVSLHPGDRLKDIHLDQARDTQSRKRKKSHKGDKPTAVADAKNKRIRLDGTSEARLKNQGENGSVAFAETHKQNSARNHEDDGAVDPDFVFAYDGLDTGVVDDFDGWERDGAHSNSKANGSGKGVDIDEIIARRRGGKASKAHDDELLATESNGSESGEDGAVDAESEQDSLDGLDPDEDELLADDAFGMGAAPEHGDGDGAASDEDACHLNGNYESETSSAASPMPHPDDDASSDEAEDDKDNQEEEARRKAFFAPEDDLPTESQPAKTKGVGLFQFMSLSRPVLKGLAAVGFGEPTPIQAKAIPVALLGKDVVGGAVTGSGKTAAFLVPILERLLYRPRRIATSRVAILMPTRELAVQCYNVAKRLAAFTDITFCRLVGGFSLREQENELKKRPDVIVATPGRFIDHMRNSASFTVETLEILVLDEADRMLQEGFADELNEILTTIPKSRQTMLFSATMTDSVDKLVRLGMTRPVRLVIDTKTQTVGTLTQEFIRLRPGRESKRMGFLMCLCHDVYTDRAIVFFRQKKEVHRARIIFGLLGLKASELHGNMNQEQRITNVEAFRGGKVAFLLATDLASRGLDIKGVQTVINYEAPQSHEIYLHRVGRTARAGRAGRACTLAAEEDRKVVKAIVKTGRKQGAKIVSRVVDPAAVESWASKIDGLEEEVEAILQEEQEEKQLVQAEMQVTRGDNLIKHEEEIKTRPKRTWFETERDKKSAKNAGRTELNGAVDQGKAKEKPKSKMSHKQKKKLEIKDQVREGQLWKKSKNDASAAAVANKKKKSSKKPKKAVGGKSRPQGKPGVGRKTRS